MSRATLANADLVLYSIGANHPIPASARYVVEVGTLRDPIGQPHLRVLDGRNVKVREWISADEAFKGVVGELTRLAVIHLVGNKENFLGIAVRDYHGKWIAPAVVEEVADMVEMEGIDVAVDHFALRGKK